MLRLRRGIAMLRNFEHIQKLIFKILNPEVVSNLGDFKGFQRWAGSYLG